MIQSLKATLKSLTVFFLIFSFSFLHPLYGSSVETHGPSVFATNFADLTTERAHPRSMGLSADFAESTQKGLETFLAVEQDLEGPFKRFMEEQGEGLTILFLKALEGNGRVVFIGSGSSGRAGIILSDFFQQALRNNGYSEKYCGRIFGKIAGGPVAMIRAQEGFEDDANAGQALVESLDLSEQDAVFLISGSGSAPFNMGAGIAARKKGAAAYYFFNCETPTPNVQHLVEVHGVIPLQYVSGPQTIRGSTRLQASSLFLLCLGGVLETLLQRLPKDFLGCVGLSMVPDASDVELQTSQTLAAKIWTSYITRLERVIPQVAAVIDTVTLSFLAPESQFFNHNLAEGNVTYRVDSALVSVALGETAELPPTYVEPHYKRLTDAVEQRDAGIRAYIQDAPEGNPWSPFMVGYSLQELAEPHGLYDIVNVSDRFMGGEGEARNFLFHILLHEGLEDNLSTAEWSFAVPEDGTLLGLDTLCLVKTTLNYFSNTLMVMGGKIEGNNMVDLSPSNTKLVSRATDLIVELVVKYTDKKVARATVETFVNNFHRHRTEHPLLYLPSVVKVGVVLFGLESIDVDSWQRAILLLKNNKHNMKKAIQKGRESPSEG